VCSSFCAKFRHRLPGRRDDHYALQMGIHDSSTGGR
jgi:hypothetical protein